VFDGF
jgi:hypothetical protein